jgi:hypothetical protein
MSFTTVEMGQGVFKQQAYDPPTEGYSLREREICGIISQSTGGPAKASMNYSRP